MPRLILLSLGNGTLQSASATLGPDMGSPINRLAWCRVNLLQGLPVTSCLFIFRMALCKYPYSNPARGGAPDLRVPGAEGR